MEHNRDDGEDRNGLCKACQDDQPFLTNIISLRMQTVAKRSEYGTEAEGIICLLVPMKKRCARVPRKGSTAISLEVV
jgi:hypothetical protein